MNHVQSIILNWFHIATEDAHREAVGIAELIGAHGADAENTEVVERAIYKVMGTRYPWKNLSKKQEIEAEKTVTINAYNEYISRRKVWAT